MKVLIHACPKRMWYVEGFLLPELERQGADEVEVWNDVERKGNLKSCMASFASAISSSTLLHAIAFLICSLLNFMYITS